MSLMSPQEKAVALLPELEQERRKDFARFVLGIVLASLMGGSGFALIIVGALLEGELQAYQWLFVLVGFVLFLLITPLFVFMALKAKNTFQKRFYSRLVPLYAQGVYGSFVYDHKKDLSVLLKEVSSTLVKKPEEDNASFYEGSIGQTAFLSFAYTYLKAGKGHPEDVGGRYVEFTLGKDVPSEFFLKHKKDQHLFFKNKLSYPLHAESILFEEAYLCSAKDEVAGTSILSPTLEAGLINLDDLYGVKVSAHLVGRHCYVYFNDYQRRFALSFGKPLTASSLKEFEDEVMIPKRLYLALDLDRFE